MKIFFTLLFITPFIGLSQIVAWDFTGEANLPTSTAEIINPNLFGSGLLTRGPGAAESVGNNSFRTVGFQNDGISVTNLDYFQTTIEAGAGYTLSLSTIDGRVAGTNTYSNAPGVTMQFAYSLDGTTFNLIGAPIVQIGTGNLAQIDLTGVSALQAVPSGTTVTIRFYASGQTTTGGWGFNSNTPGFNGLAFGGTVNPLAGCNTFNTLSPSICGTYTVPSGDETYSSSGTYFDTIPNVGACDSILTINLTIIPGTTYYADVDLDGFGNALSSITSCSPVAGYVTDNSDCDDNDNTIGGGTITYYLDADNDGFGSTTSLLGCIQPVGYVTNSLDCNDGDNTIFPGAVEIFDNGIDEDCSGADASLSGAQLGIYEFTAPAACPVTAIGVTAQPTDAVFSDYLTAGTICSQANNVFSNSGWNTTSTIDLTEYNEFSIVANNCISMDLNRVIFTHRISASGGTPTWTLRSSIDNYTADLGTGTPLIADQTDTVNLSSAFDAVTDVTFRFYITNIGLAGSTWRNDNVRLIGNFSPLTPQTFYADTDNDTYGDPTSSISVCTPPAGYVLNNTDCNDADSTINPMTTWYENVDGDNVGNSNVTFIGCTPPNGYILVGGDCDDNNNAVGVAIAYFVDADNDGFGVGSSTLFCTNPGSGYATVAGDCNDNDLEVNPDAPEVCDGADNNCNVGIDEGLVFVDYYTDADGDSFGTGNAQSLCEDPGQGFATANGDCNDNSNSVFPGATEIPNDGIDQNCDGVDGYLGIDAIANNELQVFPNPTSGLLTINQETNQTSNIELLDLTGKIVYSSSLTNSTNTIDISKLEAGSYILIVQSESGIQRMTIVKK